MFYGDIAYAILVPLAIVGVVVLAILALAGRADPDRSGDRARALYVSLVSFIALFTLLFALVSVAGTIAEMVLVEGPEATCPDPFSPECLGGDLGPGWSDEQQNSMLLDSLGVALAAGAVLVFHRRLTRALTGGAGFAGSAAARTFTAYLYAVAFTAVATFVAAAAVAVPALVRTVAPSLTALDSSSAEREAALLDLVPALVAAGGAALIHVRHWKEAHRLRTAEG